jgi:hypothetical protein
MKDNVTEKLESYPQQKISAQNNTNQPLQPEPVRKTTTPTANQLGFDDPEGGADQLYIIQLPSQLPIRVKHDEVSTLKSPVGSSHTKGTKESKNIKEDRKSVVPNILSEKGNSNVLGSMDTTLSDVMSEREFKSTLPQIPAGTLGTLRVHRSGKVSLKIGDIIFDV